MDIWTCNNTVSQQWMFSGGALSVQGKCLDDASQGGAGANLVLWTCNGHKAQTWTHNSNGEYVLKLNNLCLTDPSASKVERHPGADPDVPELRRPALVPAVAAGPGCAAGVRWPTATGTPAASWLAH